MHLKGNTKQVILDIAEDLLAKRGFNGFSYKHISSALGIKNAAVHYHYPTKSDLGVEIIQRASLRFKNWSDSLIQQDLDVSERLDAFLDLYKNFMESKERVFLVGALESNYKTLPEAMQQETRMLMLDYLGWLENLLKEGRKNATFSFPGNAKDQASVVLAILHGAMHLVLATDRSFLEAAIRQIKLTVRG
jgi:TetR/AcrR family transcriptional regulator, transcriptional repressor for nem operon